MPTTLRGYIGLIIVVLIVGYALFVGRNYLRGLSLSVTEPRNNASVHDPLLTVRGTAARVSHLFVNGAPVTPDQNGDWSYALLLPPGYSIIGVDATDRFNRSRHIERAVYYTPATTTTAASTSKTTF